VAAAVRFDHIAVAVARLADVPGFVVGQLGGAPDTNDGSGPYRFAAWRFAGGGVLEALEPHGRDGFLHRFLSRYGPGVHHVTFKVPSLRAACDRAAARGYEVVGYDDSRASWKEAFLHPKQALGIVVQLAQSAGDRPRPWTGPPSPPSPPPPVMLVGLRLRARSAGAARVQWGEVLQGELTEDAGALVARWPGSSMRLVVEIDPQAATEGPVCIEVASDRPLALPPGPHPQLGAVFVRR
jgi:Glyoxalase/Bleomycin resistance protein/Dioxygenase superfamily